MYNVLVTAPIEPEGLDLLRDHPDINMSVARDWSPETAPKYLQDVHGLLLRHPALPREIIDQAPNLKVAAWFGVGTDLIDVDALTARGIPLLISTGANSQAVAEHTMALMLAMAKNLRTAQASLENGDWRWRHQHETSDLSGRTMLILGFGHIGRVVAGLCTAFSMRVVAYSRSITQSPIPGVEMTQDFRSVLPRADFISLHLPHAPETHHIFTAEDFASMKKGTFLINTGRGEVLDESLLLEALDNGTLGGVGLDVFEQEPPDPDSPLFKHPRSFYTPHDAAITHQSLVNMSTLSAQNIINGLEGRFDETMLVNRQALSK
ncbi:hydroxyacid dehydrogenase [Oceanidesulfovibrio marinus]|nr:hydroxyacid dehydrogenase [Oceanidesulfovibrio marinus]